MKRTYVVQGRYGYFAVDEHNDQDSGVRDCVTGLPTRKDANRVANALNEGYTRGREDQAADSRDLVERAYVAGQLQSPTFFAAMADVSRETSAAESRGQFPDKYSRPRLAGQAPPWHDRPAPPCPSCSRPDPHTHLEEGRSNLHP